MKTNVAEKLLNQNNDFAGASHLVQVEGMSSPRVCAFLNRLVASMDPDEHYLEIGSWKGLTLLSAAMGNVGRLCVACDRFRWWGRYTGFGRVARQTIRANIERYRSKCAEIRLFDMPSDRFFARHLAPGPVGVYFYDGDHTFEGTRRGVLHGAQLLSERAVVLVDDWKEEHIQRATFSALREAKLDVLWSRSLAGWEGGFWHGLGAFYVARTA